MPVISRPTRNGPIAVSINSKLIVHQGKLYSLRPVFINETRQNVRLTAAEFGAIHWDRLMPQRVTNRVITYHFGGFAGLVVRYEGGSPRCTMDVRFDRVGLLAETRIQVWYRAIIERRKTMRGKIAATCMATHPRLGAESGMQSLDKELVTLICQFAAPFLA
jgi:hypothetical protein